MRGWKTPIKFRAGQINQVSVPHEGLEEGQWSDYVLLPFGFRFPMRGWKRQSPTSSGSPSNAFRFPMRGWKTIDGTAKTLSTLVSVPHEGLEGAASWRE